MVYLFITGYIVRVWFNYISDSIDDNPLNIVQGPL